MKHALILLTPLLLASLAALHAADLRTRSFGRGHPPVAHSTLATKTRLLLRALWADLSTTPGLLTSALIHWRQTATSAWTRSLGIYEPSDPELSTFLHAKKWILVVDMSLSHDRIRGDAIPEMGYLGGAVCHRWKVAEFELDVGAVPNCAH